MIDGHVQELVDLAVHGFAPPENELASLLSWGTHSAEAAYIVWGAERIARVASGGIGQIYAQIGLDRSPCEGDCAFCGLAKSNNPETETVEMPGEDVVAYARALSDAGVNLISLMCTAGYDFERYCAIVCKVRDAIRGDVAIMANRGDMDLSQAKALKSAGVQAAYHACRLGEGHFTALSPKTRWATLDALKSAGIHLMSCVEPVVADTPAEAIARQILKVLDLRPFLSSVGTLTPVTGTRMADVHPISRKRTRYLSSVMRLYAQTDVPFGLGAKNVLWTDVGADPRRRGLLATKELLEFDVRRIRRELERWEWQVHDSAPSTLFE